MIVFVFGATTAVTIFEKSQCEIQDNKHASCEPETQTLSFFVPFASAQQHDDVLNSTIDTYNEKIFDGQHSSDTTTKEEGSEKEVKIKPSTKIQLLQNFILFLWIAIGVTVGIIVSIVIYDRKQVSRRK